MNWRGVNFVKCSGSPERIRFGFALCLLSLAGWGGHSTVASAQLKVDEVTIPQVEAAFREGKLTCHQLVESYLDRIAALDQTGPAVNSFLELNPDALTLADQLDRDFRQNGPVGPLHCVPMVLKDNYDTADGNHTTAASLTMLGFRAPSDAFQVAKLRAAGAVFLGKVNMDEWAVGTSGYSSRGGQTRNPYRTNRGPGGSSAGTGVAVSAIEVSFVGKPFSEPTLIKLAFAFEQATQARRPPQFVVPTSAAVVAAAPNAPPKSSALVSQPYGWLLEDFERSGAK